MCQFPAKIFFKKVILKSLIISPKFGQKFAQNRQILGTIFAVFAIYFCRGKRQRLSKPLPRQLPLPLPCIVCRRRTYLQSCPKKEFQRSLIISIEANKWCQFWLKDNCSCRLGKWRVFYNSLTKYLQIAYNSTFSDCATRHKKYL